MKKLHACLLALVVGTTAAHAVVVNPGNSTQPWLGFMNVFELPVNGGGFIFASPWGTNDLVSTFDDPNNTLTLSVNSINDPNPFWYTPSGGPGAAGNKNMEANLYIEATDVLNGQLVEFQGTIVSNTLAASHTAVIFIRDFAPDYSSFNQSFIPVSTGPFSVTLFTDPGVGRHVQYGFQVFGPCVWSTDAAAFGNIVITTGGTPAPTCDSIDFNNDTSVFDPQDIDAFLSVYSEGPCIPASATCNDIDFNNDGSVFDPCDIDSFLLQFSEGPCTLCGN
jgi:hypothetical protein